MKLYSITRSVGALALALSLMPGFTQARDQDDYGKNRDAGGAVYTMDNSTTENHVLAYLRTPDGELKPDGLFATGGRGTGAGLGSQGAVVISANGRWLFACNAGSDEISVFVVTPKGLVLSHRVSSRGKRPISLALHRNLVFVLNAGGQAGDRDNVAGFLFLAGRLIPLPHATQGLSAENTNPAQVSFSPDGKVLVVTEKDTSLIDTFVMDNDGSIDEAKHFLSAGQTPFGFSFRGTDLIVSEAFAGATDASAASSYGLEDNGELEVTSPSVPTTESSACWVVVTANGRFAYTANTGSGTISGYTISNEGALSLLNPDGVTGVIGAGSSPADMTLSGKSSFLYCRNGNGTISAFRVNANGSLNPLNGLGGLPVGTTGLAGR